MIAFIINTCDALNVDIKLQYNESLDASGSGEDKEDVIGTGKEEKSGVTVVSISGVERALVSLPFQEARVFHDANASKQLMISAVEEVGYDAKMGEREAAQKIETLRQNNELQDLRWALTFTSTLSTLLFTLGKGIDYLGWTFVERYWLAHVLRQCSLLGLCTVISFRYGSWIHRSALEQAKKGRLNMNSLITVSTTLGLISSTINVLIATHATAQTYYDTVAGLSMIVTAGRYLDLLSRRQATNTFVGLYSLLQQTATVKVAGQQNQIPASMLRATDEIVIEPFSLIACDSYITSGSSYVNESIVTGESLPKQKKIGDFLLAGTRNGPGQLHATVNQDQEGSFLSQLVRSVEEATTMKASVQDNIEAITQYFVLIIFGLAIVVSVMTFLWTKKDMGMIYRVNMVTEKIMAVLAAACPCALGLATPCAIMAGIDVAWRKGVLMIEGAKTMEALKDITHVVMDKTGTLTRGVLTMTSMRTSDTWEEDQKTLAALVCAAEEHGASAHTVGTAIFRTMLPLTDTRWQKYKGFGALRDLTEVPGKGVKCEVDLGDQVLRSVCVRSLQFMQDDNVGGIDEIPSALCAAGTVGFVGIDRQLSASMILQDTLRSDAKATIEVLKTRGLKINMLTGDNPQEACRISQELGIPVMASSAMPLTKLEHIKALQQAGHKVAMIGDGINDGPSLAAADVGIMIAHGNKCLSSGGGVLILASKLSSLNTLLEISQKTMKQVSTNIKWALTYNIVAVSLAIGAAEPFGVHISPTAAATMMSLSSIGITLQGLGLRHRLLLQFES